MPDVATSASDQMRGFICELVVSAVSLASDVGELVTAVSRASGIGVLVPTVFRASGISTDGGCPIECGLTSQETPAIGCDVSAPSRRFKSAAKPRLIIASVADSSAL